MKDTRAESTTGSSLASEASRTKMATTKYAGGMRGRHFATRLERRVAAVAMQWHDVVGVAVYEVLWHNSP